MLSGRFVMLSGTYIGFANYGLAGELAESKQKRAKSRE
jgi:hypothetical protein